MNFASSISKAKGTKSGNTPHVDEKTGIEIKVNQVVVPKSKQVVNGFKDYLCNLELSTAPLDLINSLTSYLNKCHGSKTDTGNQTKHQCIQEAIVNNIAKVKEA